jgi:hypothetical protein
VGTQLDRGDGTLPADGRTYQLGSISAGHLRLCGAWRRPARDEAGDDATLACCGGRAVAPNRFSRRQELKRLSRTQTQARTNVRVMTGTLEGNRAVLRAAQGSPRRPVPAGETSALASVATERVPARSWSPAGCPTPARSCESCLLELPRDPLRPRPVRARIVTKKSAVAADTPPPSDLLSSSPPTSAPPPKASAQCSGPCQEPQGSVC